MGKLKEHFHDEITRGLHMDDMADADYQYEEYTEELAKAGIPEDVEAYERDREQAELLAIEDYLAEEEHYNDLLEQHHFFNIFLSTNTYPF